jgi:hypothetical protein
VLLARLEVLKVTVERFLFLIAAVRAALPVKQSFGILVVRPFSRHKHVPDALEYLMARKKYW